MQGGCCFGAVDNIIAMASDATVIVTIEKWKGLTSDAKELLVIDKIYSGI